jgi:hypothetical protein
MTMLTAISTTGRAMPPIYVHEGERLKQSSRLKSAQLNGHWVPGTTQTVSGINPKTEQAYKGGMTRQIWREYFLKVFLPNLSVAEKPALLIIDGHDSHFDLEFFLECKRQGVDVVQEPSNCSSILQALDQVCFQVLKHEWRKEMLQWRQTLGYDAKNVKAKLTRWDLPIIMVQAFRIAFTPANILSSFKRAGLYPILDVNVPLARLPTHGTKTDVKYIQKTNYAHTYYHRTSIYSHWYCLCCEVFLIYVRW